MNFFKKIYPFMPQKGDNTKLVLSLVCFAAMFFFIDPIIIVALSLTIILAPLVAIVAPAFSIYLLAGVVLTILSYAGVINLSPEKDEDQENKE